MTSSGTPANVDAGDIPVAIRQHRGRNLAAAREDDHAAAVYRERSECGDDRRNPKDSHQQSVHDAECAPDRASDEEHKKDPPIGMMLQPFGGDECACRDDGANRKIDLSGNDDEGFAQGNDANESGRQSNLLEVCSLQKARLAQWSPPHRS